MLDSADLISTDAASTLPVILDVFWAVCLKNLFARSFFFKEKKNIHSYLLNVYM